MKKFAKVVFQDFCMGLFFARGYFMILIRNNCFLTILITLNWLLSQEFDYQPVRIGWQSTSDSQRSDIRAS